MSDYLLDIDNLSAGTETIGILENINLKIKENEVHVIMGPNGTGKSTLGSIITGSPEYVITNGHISFDGQIVDEMGADERARLGMFISFQNPPEVPGLSLSSFIRSAVETKSEKRLKIFEFKKQLRANMEALGMDPSYADRDLNVGFSGGEKKKAEILQLLMLRPRLAILDETDSGLDVDAVKTVSAGIKAYMENNNGSLIVITHSTRILEALDVDYVHVMVEGSIVKTGSKELVDEIIETGFSKYERKDTAE